MGRTRFGYGFPTCYCMSVIEYARQLETPDPSLYLRSPQADDAAAFYHLVASPANKPHLTQFETWADNFTFQDAQAHTARISQSMREGAEDIMQYLAVRRMGEGKADCLVGCSSLFDRVGRSAMLGYWLAPDHCGKGYATTSAARLVAYGQEAWGLEEVILRIAYDNAASQAVAKRLGAEPTGQTIYTDLRGEPYEKQLWKISLT